MVFEMSTKRELFELSPDEFRRQVRLLSARRSCPEAAVLFDVLMRYAHRRVVLVGNRLGAPMPLSRQEELVGEVLLQLMDGGLARFRGGSLPELLGFVRVIADRLTWRSIKRVEREGRHLRNRGAETVREWSGDSLHPEDVEYEAVSPLPEQDRLYLLQLLSAGSKAELARKSGVSRAAVTQRVKRIRGRIRALTDHDRMAHDVWIKRAAREVLATEPELVAG